MKICHSSAYRFAGSDAVGIVSIRNSVGSLAYACQPSAVLPGEGETVTVGEGVSDLIVGDSLAVKGKEAVSTPKAIQMILGVLFEISLKDKLFLKNNEIFHWP